MLWLSTEATLTDVHGPSFRFDPGAPCLEFGYTGGEGPLVRFERLHTPDDWVAWAAEPAHGIVLGSTPTGPEIARARALREAVRTLAADRADRRRPGSASREVVDEAAARPGLVAELDDGWRRRWQGDVTLDQLTSALARDAIDLFAFTPVDRVRVCAADDCPLVFVDTSRPGARRWCSMARCGNRAKVRSHRNRL